MHTYNQQVDVITSEFEDCTAALTGLSPLQPYYSRRYCTEAQRIWKRRMAATRPDGGRGNLGLPQLRSQGCLAANVDDDAQPGGICSGFGAFECVT